MEIDYIIITAVILLPQIQEGLLSYVHEVRLVKLAQEKSVVMLTDDFDMTISVDWDVEHQTVRWI